MKAINCNICLTPICFGQLICENCYAMLPWNNEFCTLCAHSLVKTKLTTNEICKNCKTNPPKYITRAAFQYKPPISLWLQQLKFKNKVELSNFFAKTLYNFILSNKNFYAPDILIAVPLHKKRLKQRGFNQSHEIVKQLGKIMKIKTDYNYCIKIKNTISQTKLDFNDRKKNIANSFKCKNILKKNKIVIIDDISTTGATTYELASEIDKQGENTIEIWTIAKSIL